MAKRPGITLPRYIIIFVLLAAACAYVNILWNTPVWDDETFLTWKGIRTFNAVSYLLGALPEGHEGVYRPVRSMLWGLGYALWGANPLGYHLQAILIHVLSTYVVYLFLKRLFHHPLLAVISAVLFAVHPVHTEAVTFITASFDQYCILLYLLSVYWFAGFLESGRRTDAVLSVGSSMLSMLSGEMGLTIPGVVLLIAVSTGSRRTPTSLTRLVLPYILCVIAYFALRFGIAHEGMRGSLEAGNQVLLHVLTVKGFLHYFMVLFFPMALNVDVQVVRTVNGTLPYLDWGVAVAGGIFALSAFTVFKFRKKYPVVAFSILWFYLTLVPVMNIIPTNAAIAERYLYLPSLGWCALIAWGILALHDRLRTGGIDTKLRLIPWVILSVIVVGFFVRTIARNFDWKDPLTLWGATVLDSPSSSLAFNNLGKAFMQRNNREDAMRAFSRATELNPDNWKAYDNLGQVLIMDGNAGAAETALRKAMLLAPGALLPVTDLSRLYLKTGRTGDAIGLLESIETSRKTTDLYMMMGHAYLVRGDMGKSESSYAEALQRDPGNSSAANNLAALYLGAGKPDKAATVLDQALVYYPSDGELWFNRGTAYKALGDTARALSAMRRSNNLKPNKITQNAIDELMGVRVP